MANDKRIQVLVDEDLFQAVEKAAKNEDRTVSDFVRILLKREFSK